MKYTAKLRQTAHQLLLLLQWSIARTFLPYAITTGKKTKNVIFITADSHHLIGSRGDAAMLEAALKRISENRKSTDIHIACASQCAEEIANSLHTTPLRVWGGVFMPFVFARSLMQLQPATGFLMGADIMDGHYSPVNSLRILIASDLLARFGASSRFLGFSLNADVAPLVKLAFRWLDPRVEVNLRDPLSLRRYQAIAGATGHLVADTAFLLNPAQPGKEAETALQWIAAEKNQGRTVLGINFHPMLFSKTDAKDSTEKLAQSIVTSMLAVSAQSMSSWILVPHDNRIEAGDMSSLEALDAMLPDALRHHSYRIQCPPSAGELKTIAGATDGVITGRMHLAIATLGQSIPVLVFAYQGKFEGLMQHFELPSWVVISPGDATNSAHLTARMLEFVKEIPALRKQIAIQLPKVLDATEAPFRNIE